MVRVKLGVGNILSYPRVSRPNHHQGNHMYTLYGDSACHCENTVGAHDPFLAGLYGKSPVNNVVIYINAIFVLKYPKPIPAGWIFSILIRGFKGKLLYN